MAGCRHGASARPTPTQHTRGARTRQRWGSAPSPHPHGPDATADGQTDRPDKRLRWDGRHAHSRGRHPAWSSRKPLLGVPTGLGRTRLGRDSRGQRAGGRRAAPGVTAHMERGTWRAWHGQDALLATRVALEPLPGAGVASGTAGLASAGAGRERALSRAQREHVGAGAPACVF